MIIDAGVVVECGVEWREFDAEAVVLRRERHAGRFGVVVRRFIRMGGDPRPTRGSVSGNAQAYQWLYKYYES